MRTILVLAAGLALAGFAGLGAADGAEYAQGNAGVGVSLSLTACAPAGVQGTTVNYGGARFCAGHIVADDAGESSLSISDDVFSPTSGTYCQDLNANALCGEAPVPPDGNRLEPRTNFCGSVTLQTPIDMTPRPDWTTSNWEPNADSLVFIHSPGTGNPTNSPCGATYSGGTHGFVNHA